VVFLHYLVYF